MAYLGTRPANAVLTSEQIADGTITTSDLANNAVTAAKLDGSAVYPGFRNRIINGDMRIDQRNNGASVTPIDSQVALDRWRCPMTQSGKFTIQRNAGAVTPPPGFANYLGATSTSAYTLTSTDEFAFEQRIEGYNIADLAFGSANAQPVTLSFWVRSSLTGTFGSSITNTGARWYPFGYTISSANTWEYKTVTIPGDVTGTWATDNSLGMLVRWSLGVGSSKQGTAGVWTSSNFTSVPGAVNLVSTNAASLYITGVQLEKGSTATPFEFRSIGQELQLCERYYQILSSSGYRRYVVNVDRNPMTIPIAMRATPTLIKQTSVPSNLGNDTSFATTNKTWVIDLQTTGAGNLVIDIAQYYVQATAEL